MQWSVTIPRPQKSFRKRETFRKAISKRQALVSEAIIAFDIILHRPRHNPRRRIPWKQMRSARAKMTARVDFRTSAAPGSFVASKLSVVGDPSSPGQGDDRNDRRQEKPKPVRYSRPRSSHPAAASSDAACVSHPPPRTLYSTVRAVVDPAQYCRNVEKGAGTVRVPTVRLLVPSTSS